MDAQISTTPDAISPFGEYRPLGLFGSLISFSQSLPQNWIGKQIGQLVQVFFLKHGTVPVDASVGKIRMRCYLRDNNSEKKFLFMPWRFDKDERRILLEMMPRDGVFVDIGANVGIYSLTVATHLNAHGRIIAVEPNPPVAARLRCNLEATRQGRQDWPVVDVLELGIGETAGELGLHLDQRNLGSSSIVPLRGRDQGKWIQIPCKPLLTILDELGVSKISALKIDIEGAEDIALMPFLATAADERLPLLLIIENSEARWKKNLVGAILARGYTVQVRTDMNTLYRRQP